MTKVKKPVNYLSNANIIAALKRCHDEDKMTDEFARMMMMLATRIGTKPNFAGYTSLEDMKQYALYTIVRVWRGFDITKSNNPFSYFTQIIMNCFLQHINTENRQNRNRELYMVTAGYHGESWNNQSEKDIRRNTDIDNVDMYSNYNIPVQLKENPN